LLDSFNMLVLFVLASLGDGCFALLLPARGGEAQGHAGAIAYLYPNASATGGAEDAAHAFSQVYGYFERDFDWKTYANLSKLFQAGMDKYPQADAYNSYTYFPDRPHCDTGALGTVAVQAGSVSGMAAFPGGSVKRLFGMDMSKRMYELASSASGPASVGLLQPMALASQGLSLGAGMVQSLVAAAIHTVPPLIPPPVWNNQPLPCAPMVTGHNCFGAVLYPITMSDFVLADVTDSMLDGVIAGFPNTYATKVGKTSEVMYKACFSAYMSMHCSSIFPRCTAPQSRDEPVPVGGRVPMCLHLCIIPLVTCPGFWVSDIIGSCSMVSVPPMCTQAFFWNLFQLPPQYATFDEANPFPANCPKKEMGDSGMDSVDDPALLDDVKLPQSPIMVEAQRASHLPPVP